MSETESIHKQINESETEQDDSLGALVQNINMDVAFGEGVRMRVGSPVLQAFPWMTTSILASQKLEERLSETNPMKKLGKRLDELMESIASSKETVFQDIKAVFQGDVNVIQGTATRRRTIGRHACAAFSLFRAFDMAVLAEGKGELAQTPTRHVKATFQQVGGGARLAAVGDWVKILRAGKNAIEGIERIAEDYSASDDSDAGAKLTNFLSNNEIADDALQILRNVISAALYLHVAMTSDEMKTILDMPDDMETLLDNATVEPTRRASEKEHDRTPRRAGPNAFLIAAMYSPIHLLSKLNLASTTFDKANSVMHAKSLGNDYPPELNQVLTSLWGTVFKISAGEVTPVRALKDFYNGIDWESLDSADTNHRSWYSTVPRSRALTSYADKLLESTDRSIDEGRINTEGHTHSPSDDIMDVDRFEAFDNPMVPDATTASNEKQDEPNDQSNSDIPSPKKGKQKSKTRSSNKKGKEKLTASRAAGSSGTGKKDTPDISSPTTRLYTPAKTSQDVAFIITRIEIEDIEEGFWPSQLDIAYSPKISRYSANDTKLVVSTARGTIVHVRPGSGNDKFTNIIVDQFRLAMEAKQTNGGVELCLKNLFISKPIESNIQLVTKADFDTTNAIGQGRIYQRKPILVVTENSEDIRRFDEGSMELLHDIDTVIDMQNQMMYPFDEDIAGQTFLTNCFSAYWGWGDEERYIKRGTLREMLECARNPKREQGRGQILHGVKIPLPVANVQSPFATDMAAWKRSEGTPYCKDKAIPIRELRWANVATTDAYTCWHIDSNGWGTYISCNAGKIVVLVRGSRIDDQSPEHPDNHTLRYLDHLNNPGDVEAICLEPGDTIYLHPNTSYCTYTLENSICTGGHFYHHTTMQKTLVAYIHMVAAGDIAASARSETMIEAGWEMLHRMIVFYHDVFVLGRDPTAVTAALHVPDLTSMSGMLNLLSLCVLVLWSNAFSRETYETARDVDVPYWVLQQFDVNRLSAYTRRKYAYMKNIARNMIDWLCSSYTIRPLPNRPNITLYHNVIVPFIGNLVVQILRYSKKSETAELVFHFDRVPTSKLKQQLLDPLHEYDEILHYIAENSRCKTGSLLYDTGTEITFIRKSARVYSKSLNNKERTPLDQLYFDGLELNWDPDEVEKAARARRMKDEDEGDGMSE